MVGVAVNVTEVPEQIVVAEAAMLTASVAGVLIVIVIALEVAGLPVTPLRFDVITQVTTLPLASVVVVYVLPVPTTVVPTFHW